MVQMSCGIADRGRNCSTDALADPIDNLRSHDFLAEVDRGFGCRTRFRVRKNWSQYAIARQH